MGHNVQKAVLAGKLSQVMNMPLPALTTRSYRRSWESSVIRAYGNMTNNLKSLIAKLGLSMEISEDAWSNKRTHDAIVNALAGYDLNRTIQVIEEEIIHDADEIQRLQGIYGGSNYDFDDTVSKVKILNRTLAEKTNYLNQYKNGTIFVDIGMIVDKIQTSNDLKRMVEVEKQRILLEDEGSEEYAIDQLNQQAQAGIDDYEQFKTKQAENISDYNKWLEDQQALKEQNEKERLENIVTTEDITIPTTEPTVIPHNDEETEYVEEIDKVDEPIPIKNKIGVGIIALGAIGVLLALRYR